MRGTVGKVVGFVQRHPYATAVGAYALAEAVRRRDCAASLPSTVASVVALGAVANAGVAAARGVARRNPGAVGALVGLR